MACVLRQKVEGWRLTFSEAGLLGSLGGDHPALRFTDYWVAVKELKLSYHNGYI